MSEREEELLLPLWVGSVALYIRTQEKESEGVDSWLLAASKRGKNWKN